MNLGMSFSLSQQGARRALSSAGISSHNCQTITLEIQVHSPCLLSTVEMQARPVTFCTALVCLLET